VKSAVNISHVAYNIQHVNARCTSRKYTGDIIRKWSFL